MVKLANGGLEALKEDSLAKGVNTHAGHVTYAAVAEAIGVDYTPLSKVLNS